MSEHQKDIVWHHATVIRTRRETLNKHKTVNLWPTRLAGSGKSTIAHAVEERLHMMGCRTFVFDGDNVRHGLCSDLGFNMEDRSEISRVSTKRPGLALSRTTPASPRRMKTQKTRISAWRAVQHPLKSAWERWSLS